MRKQSQLEHLSGIRRRVAGLTVGAVLGLLLVLQVPVRAQDVPQEVEDLSDKLDVPFIASHENVVETMLGLAKVTKDDYVIDLGSGDGRIVITAAKRFGARGFGVDLNEELVAIANASAREEGVADRARFFVRDLFTTDVSQASVLTMYLLPDIVLKLRPRLLAGLKPGTRIVSHDYHMGAWRPDISRWVSGGWGSRSVVHFWVVPADVAGSWTWDQQPAKGGGRAIPVRITLRQKYQVVRGAATVAGSAHQLAGVRLRGDRIAFLLAPTSGRLRAGQQYQGTVRGDGIAGTVKLLTAEGEIVKPWRARRAVQGGPGPR